MKLDRVLTVAIGDITTDGQRLAEEEWTVFGRQVRYLLAEYGQVVASTRGVAVGSDGSRLGKPEATRVYVVVVDDVDTLDVVRTRLAYLLRCYGQSSACFAIDPAHEPCFATTDGSRPVENSFTGETKYYSLNTPSTASSHDTQEWAGDSYSVKHLERRERC